MWRRPYFPFLSKTTIVVFIACCVNAAQINYTIVPDNIKSLCALQNTSTCLSLQQFGEEILSHLIPIEVKITLNFAPGKHTLIGGIELSNTGDVFLKGQLDNAVDRPEISCIGKSCFTFHNLSSVHIDNLIFTGCFSEDSEGGAVSASEAGSVVITQCLFRNNSVRLSGGAVKLERIQIVLIQKSFFLNNSALCPKHVGHANISLNQCSSDCSASGGAVATVLVSVLTVADSFFDENIASCSAGAFYTTLTLSSTKIINTVFTNNIVLTGRGGGLRILLTLGISTLQISDSLFEDNHSFGAGGIEIFSFRLFPLTAFISNCSFFSNSAAGSYRGGGVFITDTTVYIDRTEFSYNSAFDGGAIYFTETSGIKNNLLFISNSSFFKNKAKRFGGAAYFFDKIFHIENNLFYNNTASMGGAIAAFVDTISYTANVSKCIFISNSGGAIGLVLWGEPKCTLSCKGDVGSTEKSPDISVDRSTFEWNTGKDGGAIYVYKGVLRIISCIFSNNLATTDGGGISGLISIVYLISNNFTQNTAVVSGGAVEIKYGILHNCFNLFTKNYIKVQSGGAVNGATSTIISRQDIYSHNWSPFAGGARFTIDCDTIDERCTFESNNATQIAGAVHAAGGTFKSVNCLYNNNYVQINIPALSLIRSLIDINGDVYHNNQVDLISRDSLLKDGSVLLTMKKFNISQIFQLEKGFGSESLPYYTIQMYQVNGKFNSLSMSKNMGSMSLSYCSLNFSGEVIIRDSSGIIGGALSFTQSTVNFERYSSVSITNNTVTQYGGGISVTQSEVRIFSAFFMISDNQAGISGGGIVAYQSRLFIQPTRIAYSQYNGSVLLICNSANQDGGGILAISSILNIFEGSFLFSNNSGLRGGGVALLKDSKIYLIKTNAEKYFEHKLMLTFSYNSAMHGGALFVDDNTQTRILCEQSKRTPGPQYTIECFIQTLAQHSLSSIGLVTSHGLNFVNIFFKSNVANRSGDDVYGGLLDRCRMSSFSELVSKGFINIGNGLDYIKLITSFQTHNSIARYPFNPHHITSSITRKELKELISSDPVQLCFCSRNTYNCSHEWPVIYAKRGESFVIRAVTVDQVENSVQGTVLANVLSSGTRLKVDQSSQDTTNICTELVYSVFSTQENATFELFPKGPCNNLGISSKQLTISFLPCECPSGLQPAPLDNECQCECGPFIEAYVQSCKLKHENITVVRKSQNVWIHYVNYENVSGFLFQSCPYDFCVKKPVNLSITLPLGVDKQCAFNRTGIMCGECERGLSLVFGSSRCLQCSHNYLALLIAFAFAGVALVALILTLDMTVAIATFHGLILYTNLVGANSPVFLPSETALHFFVFWVNLDLGIETCFYDGMGSYAKVLLQLVFPLYIILIAILIIVVSNYWGWFAGLIGRKNPVATLCTLFFLSYSKLLRFIIASLQFSYLTYPNGLKKYVWIFNANFAYFIPAHIPFFLIALIIIVLGSIYTMLLFFGQWLRKIRHRKLFRFFQSNQYNAFIDAYHAPFTFKHRYWIGILLFVRIIHHLISSFVEESFHPLIMSCLMCTLLLHKLLIGKIYKNWMISLLESFFIINLLLLSVGTYTVIIIGGDQVALANASVLSSFGVFLVLVIYHAHFHCWKNSKANKKLSLKVNWILQLLTLKLKFRARPLANENSNTGIELNPITYSHLLREPLLDCESPRSDQISPRALPSLATPLPVSTTVVCIKKDCSDQ